MKTISRWSFRLLRWLIVIVVLSWLISRLDLLWPWVIESTYERIQGDPDFDSRLVGYAVLGQRAESVLKTVAPGSKPLYDLISVAKNNENTWKLLTGTLERNAPGTGIALDALALVVEKAAKLTDSFHNAQQLTEVASAITNFRLNPSQASLTILGEQCGGPGAQALSDIRLDVDALADGVRSLNLNFARLMEQLGRAGNSSGLDAQLARALYSSLLALQQPLMEFDHDVQSLRSDLGRDLDTMQSIQWRVILVTKADEVISGIPGLATIRGWARTVWNSLHLALYVAVALLVSGLAFNVGDWYDRRRARRKQPEIRVIMQQPPAPRPEPVSSSDVGTRESQPRTEPATRRVQPPAPPLVTTRSSRRAVLKGSLVRQSGPGTGQAIPLPSQGKVTLGSGPGNEVKVTGTAVSTYHAAICAARTCYFVQDLESTGGTFVNGERLSGARRLQSGDIISIGDEDLEFMEGS
jgi:pSer/pThr/pTyr-binding forkhead associated (FHA) protein